MLITFNFSSSFSCSPLRRGRNPVEHHNGLAFLPALFSFAPPIYPTFIYSNPEISVPGFLLLDHTKQFRVERPLGSGGAATVFKGVLLDQELVAQYNAIDIALKKVESQCLRAFTIVFWLFWDEVINLILAAV